MAAAGAAAGADAAAAEADREITTLAQLSSTLTEFRAKSEFLANVGKQSKPIRETQRARRNRLIAFMRKKGVNKVYYNDMRNAMVLKSREKADRLSAEAMQARLQQVLSTYADQSPGVQAQHLQKVFASGGGPVTVVYSVAFVRTDYGKARARLDAPDNAASIEAEASQCLIDLKSEVQKAADSMAV